MKKLKRYKKGIASAFATAVIILTPIFGAKSAVVIDVAAVGGTVAVILSTNAPKAK